MKRAADIVAAVVLAIALAVMAHTARGLPDRWPWIWVAWAAAIPFLLLLAPGVQAGVRALVAWRPSAALLVPALWTAAGIAAALLSGAVGGFRLALWPVYTAIAIMLVATDRAAEPSGWRLLGAALALGLGAGAWDRAFKIPVPGNTPIGLTFFLAVALGLFLYTGVRPLRTLDVGLGFRRSDLAAAALAFAAVVAVALPLGFAANFVVFNPRLTGWGFAGARLLGLVIFVGIPEEMLFRGLVQEGIGRLTTPRTGWLVGSLVFGVAHLFKKTGLTVPQQHELFGLNWRYAALATIAGLGYGWVYRRTGKVSAAALTHGAVDWLWSSVFGR